jgi:hypothetical protein
MQDRHADQNTDRSGQDERRRDDASLQGRPPLMADRSTGSQQA